jgi:hypothetical protein
MHYTKAALAVFGIGLVLGFVEVVGDFATGWEWVASALMALGLASLPIALFADGHGFAVLAWVAARFRRGKRTKGRPRQRRAPPRRKSAGRSPRRKRG